MEVNFNGLILLSAITWARNGFMSRKRNYIHKPQRYVINNPCMNFNDNFPKAPASCIQSFLTYFPHVNYNFEVYEIATLSTKLTWLP